MDGEPQAPKEKHKTLSARVTPEEWAQFHFSSGKLGFKVLELMTALVRKFLEGEINIEPNHKS